LYGVDDSCSSALVLFLVLFSFYERLLRMNNGMMITSYSGILPISVQTLSAYRTTTLQKR